MLTTTERQRINSKLDAHKASQIISVDEKFFTREGTHGHHGRHEHLKEFMPVLDRKLVWSNIRVFQVWVRTVVMSRRDPSYSPVVETVAEPGDIVIFFQGGDHKVVKPPQQSYIVDPPASGPPTPPAVKA